MKKQNYSMHIATYKMLQSIPALNMPCPRCGKHRMDEVNVRNALSRHEDIYICSECGTEEALFDAAGKVMPLKKWYAVRFLNGKVFPYERKTPENSEPYYTLSSIISAKVCDKDIDDIMCGALEGGITYWCSRAEVVGEYLGEYASEQISRGGELRLYDCESDKVYTLTLDKFLRGLTMYIRSCYGCVVENGCLEPGAIDAEGADCIIQYALFGDVIYG